MQRWTRRCAALRCAAAGQAVGMAALLRGVRDELHKQGKLLSAHDLGGFAHLVGLGDVADPRARP